MTSHRGNWIVCSSIKAGGINVAIHNNGDIVITDRDIHRLYDTMDAIDPPINSIEEVLKQKESFI